MTTGRIGLIFVVPGNRETLRINGTASLNNDPALLEHRSARGKPSLLCTDVSVEECFFHCGKALVRSQVWDPDSWLVDGLSMMATQVVEALGSDPALVPIVNARIEQNYIDDL